jgi:hypothetical protein
LAFHPPKVGRERCPALLALAYLNFKALVRQHAGYVNYWQALQWAGNAPDCWEIGKSMLPLLICVKLLYIIKQ